MSDPIQRLTDEELVQLAHDVTTEGLVNWTGEAQDRIYAAAPALVRELLELRAMRDTLLESSAVLLPVVRGILERTREPWGTT